MTTLILPRFGSGSPAFDPKVLANKPAASTLFAESGAASNAQQLQHTNSGGKALQTSGTINDVAQTYHAVLLEGGLPRSPKQQAWYFRNADQVRVSQLGAVANTPWFAYFGWALKALYATEFDTSPLATANVPNIEFCYRIDSYQDANTVFFGPITKQFLLGGTTYELKSYGVRHTSQALDDFSTGTVWLQTVITWVPYEASLNLPGANPLNMRTPSGLPATGNGSQQDTREFYASAVGRRGGTFYLSGSQVTVDTVQTAIIGDLQVSEEFASAVQPHRTSVTVELFMPTVHEVAYPTPIVTKPIPALKGGDLRVRAYHSMDGGSYKIAGTVSINGVALTYPIKVLLYTLNGDLVQVRGCDNTGYYEFHNLNPNLKYTVVAHDPTSQYNAQIQDNITPVAP